MTAKRNVILFIERSRAYGRGLLRGIARYTADHSPWLLHLPPEFYQPSSRQPAKWLKKLNADGAIAHVADARIVDEVKALGIPAVIGGMRERIADLHALATDDVAISRIAVDYFQDRGFHHFAYCGFAGMHWSELRCKSFVRLATESGNEVYVYERSSAKKPLSEEAERPMLIKWLRSLPKPIALLACNDDRSRQVLDACEMAELQVPDEVAILGVDNDDLVCELRHPQLSSIAISTEAAGYQAARVLERLMAGDKNAAANRITKVSPLYIVARHSTDVVATKDRSVAAGLRFIRENVKEPIQVADVANAVSLSRRALQQRFKNALGRPVHEEIKRARVDRMARMLVSTNLSIREIAQVLRYPDVNISRYFQQLMGVTPSKYRKRHSLQ